MLGIVACSNWLDEKPDISLVVPKNIEDYQAILDNSNSIFNVNQPALGEIASDNFFVSNSTWQSWPTVTERNTYKWADDPYEGTFSHDWRFAFERILTANIVLEGIEKIYPGESDEMKLANWKKVKGSALFFRAFDFYNLTQIFCKPYDPLSAKMDLGLPLRLSSSVNEKSVRASLQETYDQIFNDLQLAVSLLPNISNNPTTPSKPSAYALLSRIYLSIENYNQALLNADLCLQLKNELVDYNTLDGANIFPIPIFFGEDIFHSDLAPYAALNLISGCIIDTSLYNTYSENDLRRTIFYREFSDDLRFWGSYSTPTDVYGGLATDEIYLIRAECYARKNITTQALNDLNTLLSKRFKSGTFTPLKATTADEVLRLILTERRKELVFRGVRWTDLRRLNKDSRFAITLKRTVNGQVFTLPPNDARYTFPIPPDEIRTSGIEQNPR